MANLKVSLLWTCRTPSGWKRYPAAMGRNGKLRPRYAQVGDEQIQYPQGHYELRRYEAGRLVCRNLGEDAAAALAEQQLEIRRLAARKAAANAGVEITAEPGRIQLRLKAQAYIDRQTARGKIRHSETFKTAISEFLPIAAVDFADQLTEEIILRWYATLRKNGNSNRTIYNKHVSVFGFLKWCGVDTKRLAGSAPEFTEKDVEVYEPEELKAFFDSITDSYHRIVFDMLLKSGLRMQEAMYLEWPDFNLRLGTLTVKAKDELGFDVKDRAERTLPIPADLIEHLKVWKKTHKGRFVLGTKNDTPNWKWLPLLKRIVCKAGLNCGHCRGCREYEECERWYLHKFRATYTTNLLRAGIDVRTVMKYTGHADMATVLRYLSTAESSETQSKINSITWMR
ncbi:MAG: site-specific integrase [Acidobacteriaceae bacterium]